MLEEFKNYVRFLYKTYYIMNTTNTSTNMYIRLKNIKKKIIKIFKFYLKTKSVFQPSYHFELKTCVCQFHFSECECGCGDRYYFKLLFKKEK